MPKVRDFLPFLKDLVSLDSKATILGIETIMRGDNISYIPIIQAKRNSKGVVSRKKLWAWIVDNNGKRPSLTEIMDPPLPVVHLDIELDTAMELLAKNPAILVKDDERDIKFFMSPRVVANILRDYSERFRIIEECEEYIRRILNNNTSQDERVEATGADNGDLYKMSFEAYKVCINKLWDKLPLVSFDRNAVNTYFDQARDYRNAVMHFRLNKEEEKKSRAVISLINLMKQALKS
jgi:CBS domain-containing protein